MFEPIDTMTPPDRPDYVRDFPVARFFSTRESFVWWWFMFLFREDGIRKQIVAYWTTKTYPGVTVNGEDWGPAADLIGTPERFSYNGMTSWWHWDGAGFHETAPRVSRFENEIDPDGFTIRSPDVRHSCRKGRFLLRFCRDPEVFDLRVEGTVPTPAMMGYRRTLLTRTMGFDGLKVYYAPFSGSLALADRNGPIRGSFYMQNITLNSPAIPWVWGVFHRDDGCYLTHFSSFVGPLMVSRSSRERPFWDNRHRMLNRNLNLTTKDGETRQFRQVRYRISRDGAGMPVFEVSGVRGVERLRVRIRPLAKTTYTFERRKFWLNRFFYNEFPSEIVEFEHRDRDGSVHREDGSAWTGNSEYSWGILLN